MSENKENKENKEEKENQDNQKIIELDVSDEGFDWVLVRNGTGGSWQRPYEEMARWIRNIGKKFKAKVSLKKFDGSELYICSNKVQEKPSVFFHWFFYEKDGDKKNNFSVCGGFLYINLGIKEPANLYIKIEKSL